MKAILRIGSWRALLGAAVALALAAICAAAAQAAPPVRIAEYGEGAGKVRNPVGVAVEQASGDLYVADRNNFRIEKFDAEGHFLLGWGFGVADGTSQELQACGPAAAPPTVRCFKGAGANTAKVPGAIAPEAVAVDQASGDVYVADAVNDRVSKFSPGGAFQYMVGKGVDQGGGAPAHPGNICTAEYLEDGDVCGAGGSGSGPGEFTSPLSLAVGASGRVWVGDAGRLQAIEPGGAPGPEIALPGAGNTTALALDSAGDFYLKSASLPGIRKLQAGTGTLIETLDAAGSPQALTVDGAGNVFIGDNTVPYRLMKFNPAGEQVSQFGAGYIPTVGTFHEGPQGNALAVEDGTGTLYVASPADDTLLAFAIPQSGPLPEGQHTEDVLPTTATLAATLNPEGHATEYHFEYGTTESYGHSTPTHTLPGAAYSDEAVGAGLEGLIPDTTYHFRLSAANEKGTVHGEDTTFATRPAVGVEAQWATDVAATSATVHADLDPLGVAASWKVEYGEGEELDRSSALHPLAAGFGAVVVSVPLSGLAPGATYRYRFVAEDERGGATYLVEGEPHALTTQLGGIGFSLADSRAWEMVSPPNKSGGRIAAPDGRQGGQVQAAADGSALAYLSLGSVEEDPEGSRLVEASSVLARRGAGGGWSSVDLTPPHTAVTPFRGGYGLEYKLFSPELERGLLEPRDTTPLSPEATERTPYVRQNTEPPAYEPLVTGADVPEGTPPFGGDPADTFGAVRVQGASADLGHVVLGSEVPLAAGAVAGSLYEWGAGELEPVSVKPTGEGGGTVLAEFGSGKASARNAISEDGSRIFWSTADGLYVRDTARNETARLDVVQPGGFGVGEAAPLFQGASADGTVAFFTDTHQLSEDSSEAAHDLYRCEVVVEGGKLRCKLTDLTGRPGEGAGVQGLLAGMSEDGTHAYFVARGVLDEAPNGEGESASPGQPNLYLWREGQGVRFFATLSEEDERDWGPIASNLSAAASPGGRYLAFMSQRPLTGYDNRDATSGERAQEVFRYDANEEELACASCNPSGARPRALRPGEDGLSEEFDPQFLWSGREVAALLPEATELENEGISLYRPRAVHDDGRLFFNAADSLVPADSNGGGDVYEYEPLGPGGCEASSGAAGTAHVPGGCVSLISSGTAEGTAAFLDASEGGNDVFFFTPAPLSATDEDEVTDVYDARVGGVAARPEAPVECLGEACQPSAVAPELQTPASAAFQGPGNLRAPARHRACAKGTRKARARCGKPRHPKQRRANRNGRRQR